MDQTAQVADTVLEPPKITETIDFTPRGMKTSEGVKRVSAAEKRWIDATFTLANELSNFYHEVRHRLAYEFSDDIKMIDVLISKRNDTQEEFLLAVEGRPAT